MMININIMLFLTYFSFFVVRWTIAFRFEEITNAVFEENEYSGIIAAFGYFNSDKLTDLFCLQNGATTLQVLYGNEKQPYLKKSGILCSWENVISGVFPGDYDGDSNMDILITLHIENNINEVKILWGSDNNVNCKSATAFKMSTQPFIVDFNADMLPDIMGETTEGIRRVWLSNINRTFTILDFNDSTLQKFRNPHSSGVLDLNNDLASDILITGENNIELWYYDLNKYVHKSSIEYPLKPHSTEKCQVVGQSSFVDMDLNGKLDHIIPVCYDSQCRSSAILIRHDDTWVPLLDDFNFENTTWGFKLPFGSVIEITILAITLRAGDVDMDGYPDFIAVLQAKSKATDVKAFILQNIQCTNCPFGRQLQIQKQVPGLDAVKGVQISAFYDIFEDGSMDVLVTTFVKNAWNIRAFKNIDAYDACFMKVLILGGLCKNNCTSDYVPYGPGPMIRYNMTRQDGTPVVSCAVQMSQSAHFPLQLPYTVFGLGQTPNFIDALTVAIPGMVNDRVRKKEWIQIIPNSQMVVIPFPPNEEDKWIKKLFVTPSHLVLLTFIALLVTCAVIAMLIGCLYVKERKEDKKEKMQDAHRFHFDAM